LRNFIESDPFFLTYTGLPGDTGEPSEDHGDHFDHAKIGLGLIITPIWNPTFGWRPNAAYELLAVAASDGSTYQWLLGLSGEKVRTEWLHEFTIEDIHMATEFLKLMLGKALADQLGSK
jgi:hypothetical protein